YLLGYAHGTERHPAYATIRLRMPDSEAVPGYFSPEAIDPSVAYIISPFGPRRGDGIPLPLLSEAGWAFVNDPSHFVIENASGEFDTTRGKNDRSTASFSGRYDIDLGP